METGRMVILLNLENLYESLYDVLNQVIMSHMYTRVHTVLYYSITLKVVVTDMLTWAYEQTE